MNDLHINGVKKICELRGKNDSKMFQKMTEKKKGIKKLLDLILFSRHEGYARNILDSEFIHCLCDILKSGSLAQKLGVLAGSGWACTLLLVARLPDDDSYRDRVLVIIPILTDLYKSGFEDKTCIINCLAVLAYYGHRAHMKLEEAGALDIFIQAKWSKSKSQSTLGAIGICYVIGHIEDHPALVGQGVEFFTGLKHVTDFCLESKPYEGFQFDPCDMAGCLARLSKAQSNIPHLVNCGIIETLKTGLNSNTDLMRFMWLERNKLKIKGLVMEILWDLSFDKAGLQEIMSDLRLVKSIKRFSYGNAGKMQEKMYECAAGILWNMQKSEHSLRRTKLKGKRAVLMSYAWQNQASAKEIEQFLKKANFDVMVMDKSAGLNSIAESVEKSSLVIMITGEAYKLSASCRLEAEYILSVRKPTIPVTLSKGYSPSGWVEEVLQLMKKNGWADNTPINMSNTELFEAGQRKLLAEITKIVRNLDMLGDGSGQSTKKHAVDITPLHSTDEQKIDVDVVPCEGNDQYNSPVLSQMNFQSSSEKCTVKAAGMDLDEVKSADDEISFFSRGKSINKPLFTHSEQDLFSSKIVIQNKAPVVQNDGPLLTIAKISKFDTKGVETWLRTTSVSPAFIEGVRRLKLDGESFVVLNRMYRQDGVKLANLLMKQMSLDFKDVMSFLYHLDTLNIRISAIV